ncbi:MAG: hypothetical protein HY062_02395 [Bacteroidetes bacterium]|nr:hypothetical protein [Bacteroidota bacterium]
MKKIVLLICILLGSSPFLFSQEVNKHISYVSIYDFLDELANIQVIELNSAIKPYSRHLIYEKLHEAETQQEKLTKRQQKDLTFFLKDYNKEVIPNKKFKRRYDLFYYRDSLFQFTLNPILGFTYAKNKNGYSTQRWNGLEMNGAIGKNFGFYFSLRDNGFYNILSTPNYLTQLPGGNYKPYQGTKNARTDFDEVRAGISYGWKWGSISLLKDNFSWGNNYNGANIFSGRQPSFAYLNFKLNPTKWFDFNYIHGWLVSQVLDSSKTYGVGSSLRKSFFPKFMAANMFTFKPLKRLHISIGNSIVYSDKYVQPIYLIPFMFFKSSDRTMNGAGSNALGENSQMFLDVSCRMIPKTHLYGSIFVDEVNVGKMFDKKNQTNLMSFKAGVRLTNLIKNTAFTFEYTRTNPWVYAHPISTTTFASNNYNMGHYLGQNAQEIYMSVRVKPIRGLSVDLSYTQAIKGPVRDFQQINGVNNVAGTPFMENILWMKNTTALKVYYEIVNDVFVFGEGSYSDVSGIMTSEYTPDFYTGKTKTVSLGVNIGF